LTPGEQVHYSLAVGISDRRAAVLAAAFEKHPNRVKHKLPVPQQVPDAVWINPPSTENAGV
jgi:putative transposase